MIINLNRLKLHQLWLAMTIKMAGKSRPIQIIYLPLHIVLWSDFLGCR